MSKETAKEQVRDTKGRFVEKEPPLVDIKVSNPVTYLKLWWKKIIANEGVDLRLKIRPLTVIGIALVFALGGFGLGRFALSSQNPIVKYIPQLAPSPTPNPWKDTAFTGILRFSQVTNKFYLETNTSQAITLNVPQNINLTKYIGRRILAEGKWNSQSSILTVIDASDLELLPTQISPIPTLIPSSTPTPNPNPTMEVSS